MDVNFYVNSPSAEDYVHLSGLVRIKNPTDRRINLAKFDMLKGIAQSPSLIGRVTFQVDHYEDGTERFATVIANWHERLKIT